MPKTVTYDRIMLGQITLYYGEKGDFTTASVSYLIKSPTGEAIARTKELLSKDLPTSMLTAHAEIAKGALSLLSERELQ